MINTTRFTILQIMVEMNLGIINRDTIVRNKIPKLMNDQRRKNAYATRNLEANIHDIITTLSRSILE